MYLPQNMKSNLSPGRNNNNNYYYPKDYSDFRVEANSKKRRES